MRELSSLLPMLVLDKWRTVEGFTPELSAATEALLNAATNAERELILSSWLSEHQPCLFGRIAAKKQAINYCFLTESDVLRGNSVVREIIQSERLRWRVRAHAGGASAFVILLISKRLSESIPDATSRELATILATLYLEDEIKPDTVALEDIYLEIPGRPPHTIQWRAGVNVFSAQADKRWWRDHRIPGGLALSVNSVGHMVKSNILAENLKGLADALGMTQDDPVLTPVDSLSKALMLAMKTISMAQSFGQGTWLVEDDETGPACPIKLSPDLVGKNHCEYRGAYHTDYTIPSEYFTDAVERPPGLSDFQLDFTYLFNDAVANPAHFTMGKGVPIRSDQQYHAIEHTREIRQTRGIGRVLPTEEAARVRLLLKKQQDL